MIIRISIDQLHKTSDPVISIDEVKKWTPKLHKLRTESCWENGKITICMITMLWTIEILAEHDYFEIYGNMSLLWHRDNPFLKA